MAIRKAVKKAVRKASHTPGHVREDIRFPPSGAAAVNKALAAADRARRLAAQKKMGGAPSVLKAEAATGPGTAWWKKYGTAYQKWQAGAKKRAAEQAAERAKFVRVNGKRRRVDD